ncbi:MAG: hypothetical protein IPM49_00660 [Flavobacteriales bacterium]|nr:hypothetical protein [Flavobacteriales bacterium]
MAALLPASLHTTGTLPLGTHRVPRAACSFPPYPAGATAHTFGHKELLRVDGRPQFAEVAILRLSEEAGWQGRWVETYGKPALRPGFWRAWHPHGPSAQVQVPIADPGVNERLHAIAAANGNTFGGCWDVVAWKDGRLVFAESKRKGKDRIRATQVRWLEAALRCGCALEDFMVVEWTVG